MNSQKKILFIDRTHPYLPQRLNDLGFICETAYDLTKGAIEKILPDYFGVVLRSRINIDKTFIDAGYNLAFVAREGVGTEHIDLEYATSKNLEVLISPEGSRDTVAEHTLGLLLCLLNNLSRADAQVRRGEWVREGNRGLEIKGKTVGILGYGHMGSAFAQRLAGFEARVIAYDKYKENYGDQYAEAVDLQTLFSETDILSIHIPYSPANHYFIDDAFLRRFNKPVFLINTARGLVLNTADLVRYLQSGQVRGAALDVLEYEESSFEKIAAGDLPAPFQYLRQSGNVVLSPHIAGWSFESKLGHARVLAEKIENLFAKFP